MKTPVPTEAQEQSQLFQWAEASAPLFPELALLHHIPNGGFRSKKTAALLKAQGVKAGVPDLCLPVARNGYHGLYIELKRRKGGVKSEAQKGWLDALNAQGYLAVTCPGAVYAMEAIIQYLKGDVPNAQHTP